MVPQAAADLRRSATNDCSACIAAPNKRVKASTIIQSMKAPIWIRQRSHGENRKDGKLLFHKCLLSARTKASQSYFDPPMPLVTLLHVWDHTPTAHSHTARPACHP